MFQGKFWHVDTVQVQLYRTRKTSLGTCHCSALPFSVNVNPDSILNGYKKHTTHIANNTGTTEEGVVPHTHCHSGFLKSLREIFTES